VIQRHLTNVDVSSGQGWHKEWRSGVSNVFVATWIRLQPIKLVPLLYQNIIYKSFQSNLFQSQLCSANFGPNNSDYRECVLGTLYKAFWGV